MAFSEQLRTLMLQQGMKAVDLARAAGLSDAAISDYLKGKKEPRGRQSIAIARALRVSLDTLWETDFCAGSLPETSGEHELRRAQEVFHQLNPAFKRYALEQLERLLELQNSSGLS